MLGDGSTVRPMSSGGRLIARPVVWDAIRSVRPARVPQSGGWQALLRWRALRASRTTSVKRPEWTSAGCLAACVRARAGARFPRRAVA
jgi:hypothetical protein